MIKKILVTICILTSIVEFGYSQTKKIKIKDLNLKSTWEEICVLKANNSIREGAYKRIISGKLSVEGTYQNGERIGIWRTYNYYDKVELEVNFDNGQIKYLTKDTLTKIDIMIETKLIPTDDRPVLNITSSNMVANYLMLLLRYPPYAADNGISGKVIIAVKVNSKGEITDYIVNKSIDKSLDDEAIRVIKLMPLEFLPAYKNGEPIDSEVKMPVNFVLQ